MSRERLRTLNDRISSISHTHQQESKMHKIRSRPRSVNVEAPVFRHCASRRARVINCCHDDCALRASKSSWSLQCTGPSSCFSRCFIMVYLFNHMAGVNGGTRTLLELWLPHRPQCLGWQEFLCNAGPLDRRKWTLGSTLGFLRCRPPTPSTLYERCRSWKI